MSSQVWLRESDLDRLEQGSPAAEWLVSPARDWLDLWADRFGVDGFNPFDTLAVGYLTHPETIDCETLPVEIRQGPDDQALASGAADVPDKAYLVAALDIESPYRAQYCHTPSPAFTEALMSRLVN